MVTASPLRPLTPLSKPSTDYDLFRVRYPAFMAELQLHRRQNDRDLAKLRALPQADRHTRVRKLLRDRRLQILYAFDALRKTRQLGAATPETVKALASEWNPFTTCREPTSIFEVPGRLRARRVVSFGPHRRMHQGLVSQIIRAIHPLLESQWLFRGGMPKALAAIEAAINEGYVYGAEVDVVHFYASVRRPTELVELLRPLPESVVQHVVWDTGVRRDPDSDFAVLSSLDDPSLNGLVGLAPGAATSPIVGEKVMAQLLTGYRDVRFVAYADNVFVLGQRAEVVSSCIQHLRRIAERLATGPLRLRDSDVHHLTGNSGVAAIPSQFTFLHQVGMVEANEDPAGPPLRVRWSPGARKLSEYNLADNGAQITSDTIDELERKVSQWRRAYPSWPEGDLWEMRYLAELAALRFYKAAEPLHKSHAAHAAVLCHYAEHGERDLLEILPHAQNRAEHNRRNELIEAVQQRLETIEARRPIATA